MQSVISLTFRLHPPSRSTSTIFFSSLWLTLSLCTTAINGASVKLPPNVTVPAVLAFGDSIIDPGNNNHLKSVVKCNFPPYGKDFSHGVATGRFSNGKIPTDFFVEALGIKTYLPAYLDPKLQPEDLPTGVSFASGASGFDPLTSKIASALSLSDQLQMLKEYITKLKGIVGEKRTDFILSNAVFVIVTGTDDIANTYFSTPTRRTKYDIDSYTDLMVNSASSFIEELYGLGARRIGVFSLPPIGCVPSQRSLAGGVRRSCAEDHNQAAVLFNSKLSSVLESLKTQLPNSKLVYVDIYNPLLDLILHPDQYGFEVVDRGCCGTGLIEVSILCIKLEPVCPNDTNAGEYFSSNRANPCTAT
ncbi:hypothetical protein Ancab_028722 [Ancistrocladus abbreviatus]